MCPGLYNGPFDSCDSSKVFIMVNSSIGIGSYKYQISRAAVVLVSLKICPFNRSLISLN